MFHLTDHAWLSVLRANEQEGQHDRYRNYGTMATIGRRAAVADFGWLKLDGTLAWLLWGIVHISFLIGFRNRLVVLLDWLWSYVTFQSGARLITGPGSH